MHTHGRRAPPTPGVAVLPEWLAAVGTEPEGHLLFQITDELPPKEGVPAEQDRTRDTLLAVGLVVVWCTACQRRVGKALAATLVWSGRGAEVELSGGAAPSGGSL